MRRDSLDPWACQAMLALLDRDPGGLDAGDALPLGWHWLYFKEVHRTSALGPDGHGRRSPLLPATDEFPRRMWAGGTLRRLGPVRLGEAAALESSVREVREKSGASGRLAFVETRRTLIQRGRARVEEERILAYREAETRSARRKRDAGAGVDASEAPGSPPRISGLSNAGDASLAPPPAKWTERFTPTPSTLFRFSALTYNAHRIHYDHPYATIREGYPGLVVHAPLTALLLLDALQRRGDRPVESFRYRAVAPLYASRPITLRELSPSPADAGGALAGGRPRESGERVAEALDADGNPAFRAWTTSCRANRSGT